MISKINRGQKLSIYYRTGIKVFRGLFHLIFFKRRFGLIIVGRHVKITEHRNISVGKMVKFEDYSEIQGLSRDGLIFGNRVTIGRGVMIRPSSYYGVDLGSGLEIGEGSSIGPFGYIGCSGKVKIGTEVMIGPRCSLFAENHHFKDTSISIKRQGVVQTGISIGNNCWIGSGVIILDGVTIGDNCVIGAGTLVSKSIPSGSKVIDRREQHIETI